MSRALLLLKRFDLIGYDSLIMSHNEITEEDLPVLLSNYFRKKWVKLFTILCFESSSNSLLFTYYFTENTFLRRQLIKLIFYIGTARANRAA